MKKKLCKSLFLLIMCCVLPMAVSAGGGNDDKTPDVPAKYNVKCEYKLKSALSGNPDLTTFAIYVDETNSKYKLTYLNQSGKEVDGKPNANITDYQYYTQNDNMIIKYSDNSGYGGFEYFDYNYKNGSNSCPALYVHYMGGEYSNIYIHENYSGSLRNIKIDVSKRYTSNDGGNTWDSGGGNTSSDKLTEIRSCNYDFLTELRGQADLPLLVSIKFQKQRNETQNKDIYNIYFETEAKGQKYTYSSLNVLGQEPAVTMTYVGKQLGKEFVIYHSVETIRDILDGSSCLDASKVYFYDYGDWSGYIRYNVTTDYEEVKDDSLDDDVYDGESGTELINAKNDYDSAVQALKDAIKKYDDNNWWTQATEECKVLFDGILDGSNTLLKNYNQARERVQKAWSNFDFSEGDKTLEKFKSYQCGVKFNPGTPIYGCKVIPDEIRDWIKDALNLVKYVALVIVIVLGVLDFLKAAGSGEAEAMKKSGNDFLKRIIAVIILFLVPVIVDLILNLIEIFGADSTCM